MLSCVAEIIPHLPTSVNSSALVRKLTAADEAQFIKLLHAVYENTYSYDILYEPGGFASLINSGQLTSYGEFDNNNRLLAHTGFWHKAKDSDYIESGCSFRLPTGKSDIKPRATQAAWQEAFYKLATQFAFIHQQSSTLHVLAQRYASQFMNAKACGLILGYAQDEKVKGVAQCSNNMHALMMTTVLRTDSLPEKVIYVPILFQSWIATIYQNLTIPRTLHGIKVNSKSNSTFKFSLETIEINPYISLERRLVQTDPTSSETIGISSKRTDLIHLPLDSAELVNSSLPLLFDLGYFPCGLRPHVEQADELILQRLERNHSLISHLLNHMKIANKQTKDWIEQWQKIVLQIM